MTPTVRSILATNIDLTADEVMRKAKDRGVKATDKSLRETVYNVKSELKRQAAKATPAPAAAREIKAPKPMPTTTMSDSSPTSDLAGMLANVALVNTVVGTCGGIEQARQVAEAVRSCGSVEAFLQHLDVVAQVRGGASA
jgi:hypothetical protein